MCKILTEIFVLRRVKQRHSPRTIHANADKIAVSSKPKMVKNLV